MPYNYDNIVQEYFENLKQPFQNYLRKFFRLGYDDIMIIYTDVWLAVRDNIRKGKVRNNTRWEAYILRMGFYQACKMVEQAPPVTFFGDGHFDRTEFERQNSGLWDADDSICKNPEMQAVLGEELGYIPEPCNKMLRMYYYEELSMTEIAAAMNYSNSRCAITTVDRCRKRLKTRLMRVAKHLGFVD